MATEPGKARMRIFLQTFERSFSSHVLPATESENLRMELPRSAVSEGSLKQRVEAYERQLIESALIATAGNQRRAAASLGLLPTTLHEKMKRLGLLRRALDDPGQMSAEMS
jgi:DNA-binding NtrC family response regulator